MPSALIVEDEAISALAMTGMIEDAGWLVTGVAASGELALEMFSRWPPDVVLMDIQLKGALTGIDVAGIITKTRKTPVVFTTAYSVTEVLANETVPDRCYFLGKPIDETRLREVLSMIAE